MLLVEQSPKSLGCGHFVKLLRQLVFLSIKYGLQLGTALCLLINADQIGVQVRRQLIPRAEDKHAAKGPVHLLGAIVLGDLGKNQLGFHFLVLAELD